jgi:hypothetical protein
MNTADEINQENVVSYLINQPVSIFLTYDISLEQFNTWNFNGQYLGSGGHLSFNSSFKNQWNFAANLLYHSKSLDTKILRGGYDMIMPYTVTAFGTVGTDPSKKLIANVFYNYESISSNRE